MAGGFVELPEPPYWAVIFSSRRKTDGDNGYGAMSAAMMERALAHHGCLGAESVRGADGFGITVAYYSDEASIAAWRADAQHLGAQRLGQQRWYEHYELRIARVERTYGGPEGRV